MALFTKSDIPECEALFRTGIVKAVNALSLDVEIDDVTHEDVPVHYHCTGDWKDEGHPHSAANRAMMLSAFAVDDQVSVLCDDEETPLYVLGFIEDPKLCTCFCLATQTLCKLTFNDFGGASDCDLEVGGELLGVAEGQTGKVSNTTVVIINNTGYGDLYINDILITGGVWDYDNWYATTGWPETWKIVVSGGVGLVKLKIEQDGESAYTLEAAYPSSPIYGKSEITGTRDLNWYANIDYQCPEPGGLHLHPQISGPYTRNTVEHILYSLQMKFSGGGSFVSHETLTEAHYYDPYMYLLNVVSEFYEFESPSYGVFNETNPEHLGDMDERKTLGVGRGYGLYYDGFEQLALTYTSGFHISQYRQYDYGGESFGEYGPHCASTPTPELGSEITDETIYTGISPPIGNVKKVTEIDFTYSVEGSGLEDLFNERGYPLVEREFNMEIEGVDSHLI